MCPDGDPEPTTTYPRSALAEDARALVSALESLHPDPYVGHGGRVELHRRLERTVRDLPAEATAEEFYRRVAPLVAGTDDAHSALSPPERAATSDRRLPLSLRVVGGDLYVEAVHDGALGDLLGGRLVGVGGESVGTLAERAARFRGTENRYTSLMYLCWAVGRYDGLGRLLDRPEAPAEPTVRVAVDGAERRRALQPVPADAEPSRELETTVRQPSGRGPRYRLYEGGEAAVFVPGDLRGYRESLEASAHRDADRAAELAPRAHDRLVGGDPPDDLDRLIAELPSMTETLTALVREMAAAGTRVLVVDLRDNPGGDSRFVGVVAYVLYGWDGVARADESVRAVKRRTDRHRRRYGPSDDAGDALGTAAANPADYDFSDYFGDADRGEPTDRAAGRERSVERARDRLTRSETFAAEAADGTHGGHYRPEQVVAVTSARTTSSAFAGAALLRTLGADVVGVPSGQSPVSYGEPVTATLPNTGLETRIAGAAYQWVPDPDGDVLSPDRELTPELFDRYDRAADAALRLAFDHAGVTDPGEVPEPR